MTLETVLHPTHLALGARMVPFGGWDMPVQYSSILAEVKAEVRPDQWARAAPLPCSSSDCADWWRLAEFASDSPPSVALYPHHQRISPMVRAI